MGLLERPGLRPMRALPLLEPRRAELEKCVFCPKLCRSACPVSNAEPRETVTPWGKMSLAWMAAHGDVPSRAGHASHAVPAWACTGCMACRESCDHRNPVADVLYDARDAFVRQGAGPAAASRTIAGFRRHDVRTQTRTRRLAAQHPRARATARDGVLVGCTYIRALPREAGDAVDASSALLGRPVALVGGCCGLPLRMAGDKEGFEDHARSFATSLVGMNTVTVVDAGCAHTLRRGYADAGVTLPVTVDTLVELAARSPPKGVTSLRGERSLVRWHDPCQLGRGLGLYDEPRAVLTRLLGRPPHEFDDARERAGCAGTGGLLPATMPETAAAIARARFAAHESAGGGSVVTGCGSSLLGLRRAAMGRARVEDIATLLAAALR